MHAAVAARNTMQHRHRRIGDLDERALINLPFPIPAIPILDPILKPLAPILTPIIDGTHSTSTSTTANARTTSTTPTQAPAPTTTPNTPQPTSTAPSSGTGGSSSNNNSGSSGDGSNSGSSSGSTGSNSGSTGSNSGSSGDSNANGSGGDSASSSAGQTSNNSGAAASGSGNAPVASGSLASDSSSGASGSVPNSGTDAASGAVADAATATNLSVVINANGAFVSGVTVSLAPGETAAPGGSSISTSAGAAGSSGKSTARGTLGGSPTGTEAGTTSSTSLADPSSNDAAVHHGLSAGIIVAICVILAVLLLLFLAFCCRRRVIAKRLRRRKTWFAAGAYAGASNNDEYQDGASPGARSARSSFATHFDRGNIPTPPPQIDFLTATSDEMSQVWPSNLSGSITMPPASHTVESEPSPTVRAAPDRSSIGSFSSSGSRPPSQASATQYLAAPAAAASAEGSPYGGDFPSLFSVRPFSPSETFSFPRPPQDDAHSRASVMVSSSVGSFHSSSAFFTPDASEHVPTPIPSVPAENPFLDSAEVRPASPSKSLTPSLASTAAAASAQEHFAPIEVVRRPFMPTMGDEMAVAPGDTLRILRRFDDGWAYAERCPSGERGLVPIDTLRAVEEDLPAFLAKKRISSYGARGSVGMAV